MIQYVSQRRRSRMCSRILLVALLTASTCIIADPVADAVLRQVYDGYDAQNGCWRARADDADGYCCLKIDRQDRVETATGPRLYLLLAGGCYDSEGQAIGEHSSPGLVGALVLGLGQNGVDILAGDPRIPMGAWGTAPTDWSLMKLGPSDYWGWVNTLGYTGQGYTEMVYSILAPYGKRIRDLAGDNGIRAGFDDAGACYEDPCPKNLIETKLDVDSIQVNERVFPLLITVTGKRDGQPITPKTWTLPFDLTSWSYVTPTDGPLASD